jgi:NAD(P)-dependent dehydrogenase (short-subunit alcohol dehydrogenase family)
MANGKIILVTGSNKGIGFEVVRQLSILGHTVILSARDEAKGICSMEALKEKNLLVHFLRLDVTQEESIISAAGKIKSQFGKLDVLINNAAILMKEDYNLTTDSSGIFNQTMLTNVHAPIDMVKHFLPLIPKNGRVIMTSSGGGSMTDAVGGWSPAYCVSKSALNAITRHLAYELSDKQIAVNAYCPGWVKTDMGGKSAPRTVEQGADTAVWLATTDHVKTGLFFRDRKVIPW